MGGVDNRLSRKQQKKERTIPGPRSLHRGIHYNENQTSTQQFLQNTDAKRASHKDLLVHHQKINEELKDVYTRTAALHKDNMTLEERIEQSWKDFERIGGRRPKKVVGYQKHLSEVSKTKKEDRTNALVEYATEGDIHDYRKGSALHNMKDRRVGKFVKRQVDRAHMLRRMGDPTPMKQSGKFDRFSNTFQVFNKTIRQVNRSIAHDARTSAVKQRPKGRKTMWDLRDDTTGRNINRPQQHVVRSTNQFDLQPARRKRGRSTTR